MIVLDRDPWHLELYRLHRGKFKRSKVIKPGEDEPFVSKVVPFEFHLLRSRPRPKVKIVHTETGQEWVG